MTTNTLLRQHIGEHTFQAMLRSVVGRRVPRDEVDDIVQSVVCDALASSRIPASNDEFNRWMIGIAKHKIADHFRRRSFELLKEDSLVEIPDAKVEARDLVQRVLDDANDAQHRILNVAIREADGESYADLATSEGTSEVSLRQRVSRFRRTMAVRWLAAAALVALLAMVGASTRSTSEPLILPDLDIATLTAIDAYRGDWSVASWTGTEPFVVGSRLRVNRGSVQVSTLSGDVTFAIESVREREGDREEWILSSSTTGVIVAILTREGSGRLATLTFASGQVRGTAVLKRR